jgi:hypothetical protein
MAAHVIFGVGGEIAKAVAIAALSCVVTKLIEWGFEEVKAKVKEERELVE